MSFKAVASAIDAETGSATMKLVLILLADYASDDGEKIYPSISTIAKRAEVSERTVQYTIRELVKKGLLEIVQERTGSTTIYRIPLQNLHPCKICTPAESAPGGVQNLHRGGATVAPKPINNLSIKQVTIDENLKKFIETIKSEYPKRQGSHEWKPAESKIRAIPIKERESVISGVIGYRKSQEKLGNIGTKYIKHPKTFFNNDTWRDYLQDEQESIRQESPVQGIHYDLVTIAGEQVKVIPGSDELFDENAWRSA